MIRRALRKVFPAFSHFYGLHPWHVVGGTQESLSFREIAEYRRQLPKKG
jgi:hypothetical protein